MYLFLGFLVGGLFITEYEVINKTDTSIKFSPYGKISTGETGSLPIYFNGSPYFPKIKSTDFFVKANESMKFAYDTDDSFLEGILIETDNLVKDYRQENFEIKDEKIIIGEIQNLPDADTLLTSQVLKFRFTNVFLYFLFLVGMTNPFLILILTMKRKKNKK